MQLIDTHVHLSYEDYLKTPGGLEGVILRAKEAGVTLFVSPGLDLVTSEQVITLAQQYPQIIPAVGLHPLSIAEDLEPFRALANQPEVKAIGEIGTDSNAGPMEEQVARLRFFLDLAVETNKPALIHIRDTWDETFAVLHDYPLLQHKAVIHCFTGGLREAGIMKELGLVMSVTAILARKNTNPETLQAVKAWPLDQMMLETDGPYLPWPGEKYPNEPVTVARIATFVAELKGMSVEEVSHQTTQTAKLFFNL